ncbi:MAG: hypothetical protein A3H02_02320 [Candidatus Niyogibacteria bacterium RIFCSPLOWO2_12_FULL_41_13]|uniref:Transposase IS200-like domain-containing protein n=1 Tax=Candidatus Niyogibacteria bacterium RIFCSPLOWO2_12_FULL_41_13 TaxID=1801726 RepID=A0A1G2F1S4_9BACT|nr:MAG: hypothetical protein A3H02_02320 [Candidatus Niyogibacteria bacterium RIFCSPLOWO2_12_FULL_41_13]
MRKIQFANGEYYHIYNRGVDKRAVFNNNNDYERFFKSMKEFNVVEPIGSIYERSFSRSQFGSLASKLASGSVGLVKFICYCLNPNHYHFLVQQVADDGIKKFMHRIGTGYTKYFNEKYERNGSLFQGSYKIVHIDSNEYLLHLSAYINLNDKVHFSQHQLGSLASKLDFKSSWNEYVENIIAGLCDKKVILQQFRNNLEYKKFAQEALELIQERKEIEDFLLLE